MPNNDDSPSTELTKYRDEENLPSDTLAENTLLQSQYIRFLEHPDDYSDISFSPTEAQFIRRRLTHLSTGAFAAIPLTCRWDYCPFAEKCPFYLLGKNLEGKACLVETTLLKEWTIGFLKEYGVHPESMTDRIYVQEMAEIELLLYRINTNLSKLQYGELVADSVSNVTPQGNVIYEEKVVPLMDLKLRLQARRDRIVKMMVGDRQEKYKRQAALKQADKEDASSKGATLKQKLDQLQRQVAIVGAKIAGSPNGLLSEASDERAAKEKEETEKKKEADANLSRQLSETMEIEEQGDVVSRPNDNSGAADSNGGVFTSDNVIDVLLLDGEDDGD